MADETIPRRGATRADVAKLAGVSTAVVSYTLNDGPKPVAAATRERVLEAVRMLDYRPNASARALSRGHADLIGLVVPSVEQPYFAELALAVERAARDAGIAVVVANSLPASETGGVVRHLAGQHLRGLILAAEATSDVTREIIASGTPTVLINQAAAVSAVPTLGPDYRRGAADAVRHLIEAHGHRQIAYVGGDVDTDERALGWADALGAAGVSERISIETEYSLAGGYDAMTALLRDHASIRAAFYASDEMAIGALAALAAAGKRVPGDFALVSFDGSRGAAYTVPPLTTVDVPMNDMARDAVAQLLHPSAATHVAYETRLVIRRSCGCSPSEN